MVDKKSNPGTLLSCQWRDVVALNFEIDDRALTPYLPPGTRLAKYNNHTMITMMAKNARELQPWGRSLTLFRSIDSIDLRCYVQCETSTGVIVGHVILHHVLSNKLCARLLKFLYKQSCDVEKIIHTATNFETAQRDALPAAEYRWGSEEQENHFSVKARAGGRKPADDSKEDFVLNQRYRFANSPHGTIMYAIRQTPWVVWKASSGSYECARSYGLGSSMARYLKKPTSVLMSSGGEVKIHKPQPIANL